MNKQLKIFGIVMALFCILGVTGCQQSSSGEAPKKYYVEGAVVSKSDAQRIIRPYQNQTSYTFNEIKQIRNSLRDCSYENFFSEKDVEKKDCKDFLTSHGCTPAEAETVLKDLDDRGNSIQFFSVNGSTNKWAFIYAEKQ